MIVWKRIQSYRPSTALHIFVFFNFSSQAIIIFLFLGNETMSSNPTDTSQIQPKEMTVDEYSDLVAKWQQAYYTWNVNCMNYHK